MDKRLEKTHQKKIYECPRSIWEVLKLVIKEMQVITTMEYHHIPIRTAQIKKKDNTKC